MNVKKQGLIRQRIKICWNKEETSVIMKYNIDKSPKTGRKDKELRKLRGLYQIRTTDLITH